MEIKFDIGIKNKDIINSINNQKLKMKVMLVYVLMVCNELIACLYSTF